MDTSYEQRLVRRLHFNWPVWFGEDFNGVLSHGQMEDVSTDGMAFTCSGSGEHPQPGRMLTIRFSVPRFGADDSFSISDFIRSGHICRVERVNDYSIRVALKFTEQLPFDPVEQAEIGIDGAEKPEPVLS